MKLSCFRTNMMMPTIAAAQSATATETSTQCEGAAAANKTSANNNESWNTLWTAVQLQATDEWLQQRLARKRASKGALVSGGGGGGGGGGGKISALSVLWRGFVLPFVSWRGNYRSHAR